MPILHQSLCDWIPRLMSGYQQLVVCLHRRDNLFTRQSNSHPWTQLLYSPTYQGRNDPWYLEGPGMHPAMTDAWRASVGMKILYSFSMEQIPPRYYTFYKDSMRLYSEHYIDSMPVVRKLLQISKSYHWPLLTFPSQIDSELLLLGAPGHPCGCPVSECT